MSRHWTYVLLLATMPWLASCGIAFTIKKGASPAVFDTSSLRAALFSAGIKSPEAPDNSDANLVPLGKALFYDKVLSTHHDISCATCHDPLNATGDNLALSIGTGGSGIGTHRQLGATGQMVPRNAPPVFNLGLSGADALTWDGGVEVKRDPITRQVSSISTIDAVLDGTDTKTMPQYVQPAADIRKQLTSALAVQALFPLTTPQEMLGFDSGFQNNFDAWSSLVAALNNVPGYQSLFRSAYPTVSPSDLNIGHVVRAIAAFETAAWTTTATPFYAFLHGDDNALGASAQRGAGVFLRKNCASCHTGSLLSDFGYHALAIPQLGPGKRSNVNDDLGRALVTNLAVDNYKFRTPPLTNVCLRNHWGHDGSYSTLAGVIEHHLNPSVALANYDPTQLELTPVNFQLVVNTDAGQNLARIHAIDPLLQNPTHMSSDELEDLMNFLCEGLTDPAASTPTVLAAPPAEVPSGLTVDE